jgi:hypothetical protein
VTKLSVSLCVFVRRFNERDHHGHPCILYWSASTTVAQDVPTMPTAHRCAVCKKLDVKVLLMPKSARVKASQIRLPGSAATGYLTRSPGQR